MQKMKISQSFNINFNYDIVFTENMFENNLLINTIQNFNGTSVAFVIDNNLLSKWPSLIDLIESTLKKEPSIKLNKPCLITKGGESAKNDINQLFGIINFINEASLDRQSILIGIGGGATLDLVGFAAAITHRGINHIRIPTTVLSQNDGGIGIKNGINYLNKKNFLGSFTPPLAVINDFRFLTTLSNRDWRSGISEAIKVALLKDKTFFNWINENSKKLNNRDLEIMKTLVYECAKHHAEHISKNGDPFERTSSRPLDFGHWAAHKLEQLSDYKIKHGEAVAIGLLIDCAYSVEIGKLNIKTFETIKQLFKNLGFDLFYKELEGNEENSLNSELINGLAEFREHLGGELSIPLIEDIGHPIEIHSICIKSLTNAINRLKTTQYADK